MTFILAEYWRDALTRSESTREVKESTLAKDWANAVIAMIPVAIAKAIHVGDKRAFLGIEAGEWELPQYNVQMSMTELEDFGAGLKLVREFCDREGLILEVEGEHNTASGRDDPPYQISVSLKKE